MTTITDKDVLASLKGVKDPELGQDLVDLGMVKDIKVCGGAVELTVDLTTPACPLKGEIEEQVRAAVARVTGIQTVKVNMTATVRGRKQHQDVVYIPGVRNTIAVGSGKGGVGKSTVCVNLAYATARTGAMVGLLDGDIYGPNIPMMVGAQSPPRQGERDGKPCLVPSVVNGVKVMSMGFFLKPDEAVVWRGPMIGGAIQQLLRDVDWGELDYLFIDLPPGTGDVQLTLAQTIPITGAVVVTTPQDVALSDVVKSISMFRKVDIAVLGIIENMSFFLCPHCGGRTEVFRHGGGRATAERLGIPFLGEIPLDPALCLAGESGRPIPVYAPESPVAGPFLAVAQALAGRVSVAVLTPKEGQSYREWFKENVR